MKWLLSTRVLKIIVTICFLVLLGLQYQLISGAYEVKREELFKNEKEKIKRAYEKSIINDKLFPGGQKVIDHYLSVDSIRMLADLNSRDENRFKEESARIYKRIIVDLAKVANIDSLLVAIRKELHLDDAKVQYALVLNSILLTFDGVKYVPMCSKKMDDYNGEIIAGSPEIVTANNNISAISVSSPIQFTNRVEFSLFVKRENVIWETLIAILPLLLLSGMSILVIIFVFFFTFNSWTKQKKLNEITTDFVNSITHEYKTPISTIKVCVKNLQREVGLDDRKDHLIRGLNVIERQSERLNKLIDQAIHTSMFDPNRVEKELRAIGDDITMIISDLKIKFEQDPNVEIVYLDQGGKNIYSYYNLFLLTTAINNLVQNGIKHNRKNKAVIIVKTSIQDDSLLLEITDNGVGMQDEEKSKVFERFYQSQEAKQRGGLGLGLYYVQQLIVGHDWKISVDSELNNGTSFIIFIPIKGF